MQPVVLVMQSETACCQAGLGWFLLHCPGPSYEARKSMLPDQARLALYHTLWILAMQLGTMCCQR